MLILEWFRKYRGWFVKQKIIDEPIGSKFYYKGVKLVSIPYNNRGCPKCHFYNKNKGCVNSTSQKVNCNGRIYIKC